MANFNTSPDTILAKVNAAAAIAASAYIASGARPGCCGRAVVELRRGTKFAKAAIAAGRAREVYPSGVWLSVPRGLDGGALGQNIDFYEKMARAMADMLASYGVAARVHSWVD